MNKYAEHLLSKIIKAEGDFILMAIPDNALVSECSCIQHGQGGKRVYSYRGKPFLELYPVKFETVNEDGSIKIRGTVGYRIIKEPTDD